MTACTETKRLWISTIPKKSCVTPSVPWWPRLPTARDLAYKPHLTKMLIVSLGNLSLEEYVYVSDVITHCHCLFVVVVIVSSRDRIWTIHSYGKFLSLESPYSGLSGTDYRLMRAPTYVFEELLLISTSRTFLAFQVSSFIVILVVMCASHCARICLLVIQSSASVWDLHIFTGYAVILNCCLYGLVNVTSAPAWTLM